MSKVLIEVYSYFGKGNGEELCERMIVEESAEKRREIIEDYINDYTSEEEVAKFINGTTDSIYLDRDGGDWDEPTAFSIVVKSQREALERAKKEYADEVMRINNLFDEEC